ncbi:MAG: NAD(P)-dependent oxidoreductase [Burkholderiaceae bacterium]
MTTLLTGAAGFLGRELADALLRHGTQDLRLLVRHAPADGWLESLRERYPTATISIVSANLCTPALLPAVVDGVDCIVHAAAGMRGATADMFANSVVGTRNLLEAAGARNVRRIILVSSFSVLKTDQVRWGGSVDESVEVEQDGVAKGAYAFAKTMQERLFLKAQARYGFDWSIVRPGVIYGPGASALSPRVGLQALGFFFSLGRHSPLPLTHVRNCADAIALVAHGAPSGSVYHVVDDEVPTCYQYLNRYRRDVRPLRVIGVPYWALLLGSRTLAWYHRVSKGQLPQVLSPHAVRSMFRPIHYSNGALKSLGWRQPVHTADALASYFRSISPRSGERLPQRFIAKSS